MNPEEVTIKVGIKSANATLKLLDQKIFGCKYVVGSDTSNETAKKNAQASLEKLEPMREALSKAVEEDVPI